MANEKTATDTNGRKYALRDMTPGTFMDVLEASGGASQNQAYVRYATCVCAVSEIDGIPEPMPADKGQLRALADKIGTVGMAAVLAVLFPPEEADADAQDKAMVEQAKN